jgi:hypothetical protein
MASYNFKSAGKTQEQIALETIKSTRIPYGIKTPLLLGTTEGILSMNYSLGDQFADNLRNLLLTNWGERLGLFKFGANLKPLTTEFANLDDFDSQAIQRIKDAVEKWMPFIDLQNFSSQVDRTENKNTAVIKLNISYNIPALQITNKGLQIVLNVI